MREEKQITFFTLTFALFSCESGDDGIITVLTLISGEYITCIMSTMHAAVVADHSLEIIMWWEPFC